MCVLGAGKASPYPVVTECVESVLGSAVGVPRCRSECLFFVLRNGRSREEVERWKNGADSGLATPRRSTKRRLAKITIANLCV